MNRLNAFLLAALVVLTGATYMARSHPEKPNYEFIPDMMRTAAYDSFSANENFADRKTLQAPVPGTIPFREERPATKPAPERGQAVFATFCQPCHGATGKGDGAVSMRGFPPPPSLLAPNAMDLTDEKIFEIVSSGFKNMPGYAAQIEPDDRRQVIAYIRSMQRAAAGAQQEGRP